MPDSPAKKTAPSAPGKDAGEKLRLLPDPKKKKDKEGFSATGEFTEIEPDRKKGR
jgi:hypothetical protein